MPKFTVEAQSKHSAQETFSKIKTFLDTDQDLRRMDGKYRCEFDDKQLSGNATGGQFSAALKVESTAEGSKVAITVDLPFALGLFKGKIQQVLQKKLDHTLS